MHINDIFSAFFASLPFYPFTILLNLPAYPKHKIGSRL